MSTGFPALLDVVVVAIVVLPSREDVCMDVCGV